MRTYRNAIFVALISLILPLSSGAIQHCRRGPTSHIFIKKHLKAGFKES